MQATIYTPTEERINTITHGIGAILSVLGLILLVQKALFTENYWDDISFTIYGVSLVVLYSVSTLYHAVSNLKAKRILQIADHIAIFLLIAGTYTPVMLLSIRDQGGSIVFITIWTLAFLGILLKLAFTGKYNLVSTLIYIGMGWTAIFITDVLIESLPQNALLLFLAGGISYTCGTLFYLWEKLPHNHGMWHVMVILGSICHYLAIYYYI